MDHAGQSHIRESLHGKVDLKKMFVQEKNNLRKEQKQHNPARAEITSPGLFLECKW